MAGKKEPERPPTRAERITNDGGNPLYPDVGEAEYIVEIWRDMGMVGSGGMGMVPLLASELLAWQEATATTLTPYESGCVLSMSRAYCGEASAAEKIDCPPPFGGAPQDVDRDAVARKVTNAFQALARPRVKQ